MRLIIGLGNPGEKYRNTRHNVGHMVVDSLGQRIENRDQRIVVKKTGVFMNESGKAVKKLITDYRLPTTDLYIIHDDLDIPLGQFKIQFGRGPKDHNGVKSVEEELKTNEFWRIRVGIENRVQGGDKVSGEVYTLQDFLPEEREIIDKVISEIAKQLTE